MIIRDFLPQFEAFTRGVCAALAIDEDTFSIGAEEYGRWIKPQVYLEIVQGASSFSLIADEPEGLFRNCEQVRVYYCEDVARAMFLVADEWARLLQGYGRAG